MTVSKERVLLGNVVSQNLCRVITVNIQASFKKWFTVKVKHPDVILYTPGSFLHLLTWAKDFCQ